MSNDSPDNTSPHMTQDAPVALNTQGVEVMVGLSTKGFEVMIDAEAVFRPLAVWVGDEIVWFSDDYPHPSGVPT